MIFCYALSAASFFQAGVALFGEIDPALWSGVLCHLLLLLGAFDPAAVGESSSLLMPEERKFLALRAMAPEAYRKKWLMPLLMWEPYAGERWAAAVRLAWRWKAPDFLSPACCSGCARFLAAQWHV
ncbi:hypothetical protein Nepgr_031730 [Nepenthes gracilis]|uniref:Uncharacterized protein n=1 Tax=Nepenthes gracilis TaxID=150966 RepID=A0AAD3TI38_NEPGR|nr:hypothetical protein Nepgr_031730 [Nepenthes gracilis]